MILDAFGTSDRSIGATFSSPALAPMIGLRTKGVTLIIKSYRDVPPGASSLASVSVEETYGTFSTLAAAFPSIRGRN